MAAPMAEHTEHLPDPLPAEPLGQVARWLAEAWAARQQPNPLRHELGWASDQELVQSLPGGGCSARYAS